MLTALATVAAQLGWALLAAVVQMSKVASHSAIPTGTMLFVAVVAGACCLLLTPVTLKIREIPPPPVVVVSAVVVGVSPFVTVLLRSLLQ